MLSTATSPTRADVRVRPIEPDDADAAARIIYEAFAGIHDHHRFARDFPTLESAVQLTSAFTAHPSIPGVVADSDGRVGGSNFLHERGPGPGVGPITVDPAAQGRGVGRRLMRAVIERGADGAGIRLLQDAFNVQSLSLYASLGFEVAEPIVLMTGRPATAPIEAVEVRPLEAADIPEAERLHRRVHGFERTAELRDALAAPPLTPTVAIRGDRVVAYATTLTFFPAAYAVAESDADLLALIAGTLADSNAPGSFLVPTGQTDLFRSLLAMGLRVVKPMVYMTIGEYRTPDGAWIPTVLY